ncbi:PAS domain S-box protein [Sulfurospirillum oryzae]|uniref:PAS domain S-box protein n=1 Tax=Sulfurospirillum oryzae TaxID=2976535 RepID=UPI0021E9A3D7|nr:PAS domain S-box protein [Sulfurospirillum oryzae]
MYWRIILFIMTCFLPLSAFESFQILDEHPSILVSKPLSYTTGNLSPLEAHHAFAQNHFQPLPAQAKSFGFSNEPIWLGIEIQNSCVHNLLMGLQNLSLAHIEYYIFQKDILIQQGKTGASVPIIERPIKSLDLRIPLLETSEPTLYLIKIETHSPLFLPIVIGTDGALQLFILPEIITIAIFTGIFLALFLYNSILFISTKEKDYLLYSLYIFFLFALMLSTREYFAPFLQTNLHLQDTIKLLSLQGSTLFMVLFSLSFLNIKTLYPSLYKRTLLLSALYFILFFTIPFIEVETGQNLRVMTIIFVVFTSVFLGIFSHLRGNTFAKYYLIASSGFSISAIISMAMAQGFIPYTYMTYNATIFGAVWQIILFSLALGYKIKLLYREHTKAMTHIQTQNKMLFLQSRYTSVGELIRNITHQWKEPLGEIGSIQTNLKSTLVFQGSVSNEKLLNAINLSHKIIAHLSETIDTFYRFFRAKTTENQEFDITKEIDNLQRMVKYTFDCEQIELTCKYSERPILLCGHPNEFAHAILNIILNAKDILIRRHIKNPRVSIDVSTTPTNIIIHIEDNGGGILQEPISKIFDAGISSNEENIGIGLYIAKTIVEQKIQGRISVKNSDVGAIFTLVLPHGTCESTYSNPMPSFMNMEESAIARISRLEKDIARRIEVEKNLKQWAHIFENVHWGIAICNVTTNTFDLINPEFAHMHGFSVEELLNQPIETIFSPKRIAQIPEVLKIVHEEGHYVFESEHLCKNGSTFPVDIDMIAVQSEQGEILYYIVNVRDITLYKQMHEQMLLKKFALDHIQDAVFMIDENAHFYYVNQGACTALGYSDEEFEQMNVGDIDPDWPQEKWKEHWNMLKDAGSMTMELRHKRKNGTIFPVEVSANYIAFGGKAYNMGIARDISERLLLEKQKEDERMRLFFEKQLVGMAITSPEKGWLHTNEKLQQMLGYTNEELKKLTWVELTHPDDLASDLVYFNKLLKGEIEDYILEKRFMSKDGTIVYTTLAVSCVRNNDHSVNYVLALVEDITEQKLSHEALAQKEQELRLLADSSPGMMGSFCLRSDGSIYMPYVSPNIVDLFGLQPEDVNKDAMSLMALTHPDDAQRINESIAKSAEEMSVWHEEYRIIHPLKGERWMESNTKPERNANGEITWYGYVHDITERKQSELALDEVRQRLQCVLQGIPDPVWMKDANGHFLACNHGVERLFNTKEEDIIGKDDYDFFEPELAEFYRNKDRSAAEVDYGRVNEELWTFRDNGEQALMETRKVPVKSSDGKLIGVLGVARDITERKRIEEKLKRSEASLNKAQNIAKIGSWELDIDSDTLTWSDETYRIFELNPEQTTELHKTFYEIVHPDDREMVSSLYVESVKTKLPYAVAHRIVMRDGRIKHVLETCETQYDEDGNPKLSIGTVQDITERNQMEVSLKESNERYTQILDNSIDVIYLIEVTPEGHFIYVDVNTAFVEVTGIPREVVIGLRVEEIEDETFRAILIDKFTTCLNAGETTNYVADYPFPAGIRTFHSVLAPIRDENGRIVRIVGAARDITERQRTEEMIKELNATLEAKVEKRTLQLQQALEFSNGVINALPDLLFEIDLGGTYLNVWARDEELLARHKKLLLGHNVYDVLSPEAANTVIEALSEANTKGVSFGKTIKIELSQGAMYFEESVSKKMSSGTFLVLSHDITERKKAELELQEREEKFSKLFKLSPAAISITSLERNMYLDVNDSFLYHTGYTYEEVVGKSSAELGIFVNPEERAEFFRRVMEDGYVKDFNYTFRAKNGTIGYAMAYASLITFKGERCLIGHSYDMSERKKIEILQHERLVLEERLSKIATAAPGVNYIFEKTAEGNMHFTYVASGFTDLFGISCDDALTDFAAVMEHIHPSDRDIIRQSLVKTEQNLSKWHEEFRVNHPEKGTLWIEGQSKPEAQMDGSILWYGFFHDATERKVAEGALAKSEEAFRAIVENSPDVIARYDLSYRRIYVNPMMQRLLNRPIEELLGERPSKNTPLPKAIDFEKLLARVIQDKQEITFEAPFSTPDGEEHWGNIRIIPEMNTQGEVMSVLMQGKDITQQTEKGAITHE